MEVSVYSCVLVDAGGVWFVYANFLPVCTDRVHVIDMLPHLWMLDGRMISGDHENP